MKYVIQHFDLIEPASYPPFEEEVRKRMNRLQRILRHYPKELVLEIFVSIEDNHEYVITAALSMKNTEVAAIENGFSAPSVISNALDALRNLVKEIVRRERAGRLLKRKDRLVAALENSRHQSKKLIKDEDRFSFTKLVREIFPEMDPYIKKQLSRKPALVQRLKKKKFSIDNVVEEVYIGLYRELKNETIASEKLVLWAFALADKEIDKLDQKYNDEFPGDIRFGDLDNEIMQQELAAGADFSPMLESEFEESYLYPGEYQLQEIVEDAGAPEEIIERAGADDIDIDSFISTLTKDLRIIFEWYYFYHIDTNEIARIKKVSEIKVLHGLKEARAQLLSYLSV